MLDELGLRRRARGEVQQQRVGGPGGAVGRERRRAAPSASRVGEPAVDRARRPRSACSRPGRRRTCPRRADGDDDVAGVAALDAVDEVGGRRAACVAGMITAPSFIAARIVSHSSTWLPSISDHPVAAARRRASRSQFATWFERAASSANVRRLSRPSGSTIHSAGLSPRSPAAIASNQSSAQLNSSSSRPAELAVGRRRSPRGGRAGSRARRAGAPSPCRSRAWPYARSYAAGSVPQRVARTVGQRVARSVAQRVARLSGSASRGVSRGSSGSAQRGAPGALGVVERDLEERLARRRLAARDAPDERDRPRQRLGADRAQLDRRAGLARPPSAGSPRRRGPCSPAPRTAPISVQMNALRGSRPRSAIVRSRRRRSAEFSR